MDDREQLQPILDSFGGFQKVQTVPLFSLHLLFTLILDIVAIAYAVSHPDPGSRCREYFIVIYIHIALWFLTFVSSLLVIYIGCLTIIIILGNSLGDQMYPS